MHYIRFMTSPGQIANTCVMQTLRAASRAVTQAYEAAFAPFGLTASQFSTLVAAAYGDGASLSDMADRIGMDRTTLTRVLDPLVRRGLVVSSSDKRDARTRLIRLSGEGRALLSQAIPAWEKIQAETLARIGKEAWPDLKSALMKVR
jgi:DNA-binding MarR family transcriptional regulator